MTKERGISGGSPKNGAPQASCAMNRGVHATYTGVFMASTPAPVTIHLLVATNRASSIAGEELPGTLSGARSIVGHDGIRAHMRLGPEDLG